MPPTKYNDNNKPKPRSAQLICFKLSTAQKYCSILSHK